MSAKFHQRGSPRHQRKGHGRDRRRDPPHDPVMALQESQLLEEMLQERACLPVGRHDDERRRQEAIETLESILCEWASVVQEKSESSKWKQPRVSLITFGSYRLGVHRPDSDLDVLAMAPPSCSRADFFTSLVATLRQDARIQDVHAIPSAYTPVIKFRLNQIQVDMLFGRASDATKLLEFQQKSPPPAVSRVEGEASAIETSRKEYMVDDADLVGVDEAGVRSLNGVRVTQLILEMVEKNIESFRITLAAVKEWAIIHGVYSNVLGFLGGINLAILVAWVCKRHPEHKPTTLLRIFFRTFALWKWPTPVSLCPVQRDPPEGIQVSMPVWDPDKNPRDAKQLMPILTPAYPSMNSAYNVGVSQLRRMQQEMIRAARILERGEDQWRDIFNDTDFFFRHSNFLQVSISAKNSSEFLPWQRFCESRLRLLIAALETPKCTAWPFAKFFRQKYTHCGKLVGNRCTQPQQKKSISDESCKQESHFFIALRFAPEVESVDLRYYISDFLQNMNSWEERKEGMDLGICHVLQRDLPQLVFGSEDEKEAEAASAPVSKSQYRRSKQTHENLDVKDEQGGTKLTPKMQRSSLTDDEIHLQSPAKKARNREDSSEG